MALLIVLLFVQFVYNVRTYARVCICESRKRRPILLFWLMNIGGEPLRCAYQWSKDCFHIGQYNIMVRQIHSARTAAAVKPGRLRHCYLLDVSENKILAHFSHADFPKCA